MAPALRAACVCFRVEFQRGKRRMWQTGNVRTDDGSILLKGGLLGVAQASRFECDCRKPFSASKGYEYLAWRQRPSRSFGTILRIFLCNNPLRFDAFSAVAAAAQCAACNATGCICSGRRSRRIRRVRCIEKQRSDAAEQAESVREAAQRRSAELQRTHEGERRAKVCWDLPLVCLLGRQSGLNGLCGLGFVICCCSPQDQGKLHGCC